MERRNLGGFGFFVCFCFVLVLLLLLGFFVVVVVVVLFWVCFLLLLFLFCFVCLFFVLLFRGGGGGGEGYNLLNAPQTVSNVYAKVAGRNRAQVTCNTSGDYHKQHVASLVVRLASSAIQFDTAEIECIFTVFHQLKPLTDDGGKDIGLLGDKPPTTSFRKCLRLKPKIQAPTETRTHALALVVGTL